MDFNKLMSRMRDLDQPTAEAIDTESCAMTPPMSTSTPVPPAPSTPPPSMSVNLNAQGMENIESMMKLFQRVNPDMMPKVSAPMPPADGPVLKMLPKLGMDKPDNSDMINKMLPKEEFGNSAKDSSDTEYKDVDAVLTKGNDLNKPKRTFPKVAGGDNPMQRMESQADKIKAIEDQLKQQLEEMKGNR